MQYQPYFSLGIYHPYYYQNLCRDFDLEPTYLCQQILKGHRLVIKTTINGLKLFIPVNSEGLAVLPLDQSVTLTFLLKLNNPNFTNFTQLEETYQPSQYLYVFSNELNNNDLTLKSQIIEFSRLTQAKIALTKAANQAKISTKELLRDFSELELRCGAIAELNSMKRGQIFSLVEIHPPASQNQELIIFFQAKKQIWSYYLITDKGELNDRFSIKHPDNLLTFHTVPKDNSDRLWSSLEQKFPNSQTILLRSETPVDCHEIGKSQLQLIKQGVDKPWIPNLPNPPNQHGISVINLCREL